MTTETRFWFNDREVTTSDPPGMLVLDFLRNRLRCTGTKEGCREGDCGACAVLIGRLDDGQVRYAPVTSCLMPLGELHGKHLVSIEGLNLEGLTPVQQAIVDTGATQCGFCTPGIVVSLTGFLMQEDVELNEEGVKYALGGHLCRCTGYRSLKASCGLLQKSLRGTGIEALIEQGALPGYFRKIPQRLSRIPAPELTSNGQQRTVIAGGTDLYVQRGQDLPLRPVQVLNLYPGMRGIRLEDGHLCVGALTSFEDFAAHPTVQEMIVDIRHYMSLIASWQIRTRATLGGNIVNASPIGDMTILLLALDSVLLLQQGGERRLVPLKSFFQGYKQLDMNPGEILIDIRIPATDSRSLIGFEKVSKRTCLDIASVNLALRLRCRSDVIEKVGLAAGGVAPIPLYLHATCRFLRGKPLRPSTLEDALAVAQSEIWPISDIRGSAEYKRLLVRQLMVGQFYYLFPEIFPPEAFYAAR